MPIELATDVRIGLDLQMDANMIIHTFFRHQKLKNHSCALLELAKERLKGVDLLRDKSIVIPILTQETDECKKWSYSPLELAIEYEYFDILDLILNSEECTEEVVAYRKKRGLDKLTDDSILCYAIKSKSKQACQVILKGPHFKLDHFSSNPSYFYTALICHAYDIFTFFSSSIGF